MTVQLDWPDEVVAELTQEAREKGLSLDDYLLLTVLRSKAAAGDEDAQREIRQAAGRSIRELRKGNILGPDLTIRDLIEEGRRY